jgi:hypothetical protein
VNRFRDTGSVQDRNGSGRPSVLGDDSLDDIRQTLFRFPRKSLRKHSLQSGLTYGSVHKAAKILKLHPCRVHVMHELKGPDKEKWLQYCRWFTHFIRGCMDILDKFFYCFWDFRFSRRYTLEELKQNTELGISDLTAETLHRVASDMRKRVNVWIAGHFQNLI